MADDNSKKPMNKIGSDLNEIAERVRRSNEANRNRPMNKVGMDDEFSEIAKIGARYSAGSVIDTQDINRVRQAQEDIAGLTSPDAPPGMLESEVVRSGIREHQRTIDRLSPRIQKRRELRQERAIRETTSAIQRQFSSSHMNGQIRSMSQSFGTQERAMGMVGRDQRELERERADIFGQIGEIEQRVLGDVEENLYVKGGRPNEDVMNRIKSAYRSKQHLASKAATIDIALKKQRQAGLDIESRDQARFAALGAAEKTDFQNQVSQELRSGQGLGSMNLEQLKMQEAKAAKELIEVMEKLKNSAGESSENLDKLRSQADEATATLKKTQEAIRQGGGGGGGSSMRAVGRGLLDSLSVVGSAVQESLINQPLAAMSNRIGNANLTNRMYAGRNAAIAGDMTALMTATGGIGSKMEEFGSDLRENADIVRTARIGEGVANTVAGGINVVSGIKNNANPAAQVAGTSRTSEITQGVRETIGGLAQTTVATTDAFLGVSRRQAELAGRESAYSLAQEMNAIPGDFRQKLYDYSMGTRQAALAAGGAGGGRIMSQFAADRGQQGGLLSSLEEARINPQVYAQMMAQGASGQGSVFSSDQVFAARRLERSGNGTIEMNMQRMSQLANAGANNPQAGLGSVLEAAFSKSLDSSKALNMMVQNTAEMVKSSFGASALGIDTTAGAAGRLAGLADTNMTNREAAAARAASAEEQFNQINKGIGANFSDMLTVSQISKESGLSNVGAMALKKLDNSTVAALQKQISDYDKMTPNQKAGAEGEKLRNALYDVGLGESIGKDGEINTKGLQAGLKRRNLSVLNSGAALNLISPKVEGYSEFAAGNLSEEQIKSDPKYRELRSALGRVGAFATQDGLTSGEIMRQVNTAGGESGVNTIGRSKAAAAQAGAVSGAAKTLDEAATSEGADFANKARQAAKELGGVAEAMSKINRQMQSLVGQLNDKSANSFQNAAAESASTFKSGAEHFMTAVGQFSQTVQAFKSIPMTTGENIKQEAAKGVQYLDKQMNRLKPGAR